MNAEMRRGSALLPDESTAELANEPKHLPLGPHDEFGERSAASGCRLIGLLFNHLALSRLGKQGPERVGLVDQGGSKSEPAGRGGLGQGYARTEGY